MVLLLFNVRASLHHLTPHVGSDIKDFLEKNPPETRFAPGIESLIATLKARGTSVYLITGGFR